MFSDRLVSVLIVLGIFFFIFPNKTYAHEENSIEVLMYNDHYEPKDFEIEKGEEVRFINKSESLRWPASNIHPTHEIYSEFDPKEGIQPGETWSFVFTKPGVWKYHDHLNPQIVGNITVTGEPDIEQVSLTFKQKFDIWWEDANINLIKFYYSVFPDQQEKALKDIDMRKLVEDKTLLSRDIKIFSAETLMKKLLADSGDGYNFDCHREAHIIGRETFKIIGAKVFELTGSECHSGFYHGAMEELIIEKGEADLQHNVEDICNIFTTNFGSFECFHGVGHGVMAYVDYNLPEALEICNGFETSFERSSCAGGVFMENIVAGQGNASIEGHQTNWLSDDMQFPCNTSNIWYQKEQCYLMQTSWMLYKNNYDFEKVSGLCSEADPEFIKTCYQSYGRDASGFYLRDPKKTLSACSIVPSQNFTDCVSGGVQVVLDFWGEGVGNKGYEFCQAIEEDSAKKACNSLVDNRMTMFK